MLRSSSTDCRPRAPYRGSRATAPPITALRLNHRDQRACVEIHLASPNRVSEIFRKDLVKTGAYCCICPGRRNNHAFCKMFRHKFDRRNKTGCPKSRTWKSDVTSREPDSAQKEPASNAWVAVSMAVLLKPSVEHCLQSWKKWPAYELRIDNV